ncbi:MAG TPA: LytR C-terminal domain-containing protein [Solirubrobacteraceae bacterium]|jgi:hypothetical protein
MASLPLALSVHSLVSSVGADAGFAAVIGLAILALLYFAHARETANLREEAAMLAQRLQDAEARLDAARRSAPAQTAPSVAPAPAAVLPGAQIPFAPAGLAAPELASATRFIPVTAASPGPAAAPVAAPALAGAVPAASSITASRVAGPAVPAVVPAGEPEGTEEQSQEAEPGAPVPADPTPAPVPPVQPPARPPAPAPAAVTAFRTAPATVAGAAGSGLPRDEAANGASAAPVGLIDEPAPAASEPPPPPPAPPRVQQGPILPPDRNVFVSGRTRRGPPIGRRFAALLGMLVVIGAVAAVVIATSGTGTQKPGSGAGQTPARPAPAFNPALFTVAVLNGTNTNQLAHHVADRLAALGYKEGSIATASNQTLTSSIVGYQPGAGNRTAALHIAKTLKLPARSVAPADQAARTVACPPPSTCTANVIITVGANLAAAY